MVHQPAVVLFMLMSRDTDGYSSLLKLIRRCLAPLVKLVDARLHPIRNRHWAWSSAARRARICRYDDIAHQVVALELCGGVENHTVSQRANKISLEAAPQ